MAVTALIDTNIGMYFLKGTIIFGDSFGVVEMVEVGNFKGYITANSITDIAYILKRGGILKDKINELI